MCCGEFIISENVGVVQPRATAGLRRQRSNIFVCLFFFTFSQGKRRRCYEDETDEEKQKGQLSQNSLWLVVGGRYAGFLQRKREEGRSLTRRGRGRKASSNLNGDFLSHLLYRSFFFVCFFFPLPPPGEQLQNFLGPQADACFRVTPVPNVGKSSALLMSGA